MDIRYTLSAGPAAVLMILLALLFRSVGVSLCVAGTKLNRKERLFCMIAYLPKATVLSVAVLAILITAPLGALGMDLTYKRLLTHDIQPG